MPANPRLPPCESCSTSWTIAAQYSDRSTSSSMAMPTRFRGHIRTWTVVAHAWRDDPDHELGGRNQSSGRLNRRQITSNVNIVLVNVPGGVPVLPGSNTPTPLAANRLAARRSCE